MEIQDLYGFGLAGYRSFYGGLNLIGPLDRVNLIAGQNNSGKSNVLRFVSHLADAPTRPSGLDAPRRGRGGGYRAAIAISPFQVESIAAEIFRDDSHAGAHLRSQLVQFLQSDYMRLDGSDASWLHWVEEAPEENASLGHHAAEIANDSAVTMISESLARGFLGSYYSSPAMNIRAILERLADRVRQSLPQVTFIEASRRITADLEAETDANRFTGSGLIRRLSELQNPAITQDSDRARFASINSFVRSVTEEPDAQLEISHNLELNVRIRGVVLPLEHLGTGVTQVVILAAASTLFTNTVLLMEEPEVHLHPLLQRKLLRYLHQQTDNQYIIATHSAHMLDSELARVFHAVQSEDEGTQVSMAVDPSTLSNICADLGYRPSDLLQSNLTIWVEGPSDRIYLAHWIQLLDPSLREGIDYSIMFYGGRLLSNLTANDPEVSEFISLRRLNRNIAILIDSDKSSRSSRINSTKSRVVGELSGTGLAWVTRGRYVENYVPPSLLNQALRAVHPRKKFLANADIYSDCMRLQDRQQGSADKVKVAKAVVRRWTDGLDINDLHKRVVSVVDLIRQANGEPSLAGHSKTAPVFDLQD